MTPSTRFAFLFDRIGEGATLADVAVALGRASDTIARSAVSSTSAVALDDLAASGPVVVYDVGGNVSGAYGLDAPARTVAAALDAYLGRTPAELPAPDPARFASIRAALRSLRDDLDERTGLARFSRLRPDDEVLDDLLDALSRAGFAFPISSDARARSVLELAVGNLAADLRDSRTTRGALAGYASATNDPEVSRERALAEVEELAAALVRPFVSVATSSTLIPGSPVPRGPLGPILDEIDEARLVARLVPDPESVAVSRAALTYLVVRVRNAVLDDVEIGERPSDETVAALRSATIVLDGNDEAVDSLLEAFSVSPEVAEKRAVDEAEAGTLVGVEPSAAYRATLAAAAAEETAVAEGLVPEEANALAFALAKDRNAFALLGVRPLETAFRAISPDDARTIVVYEGSTTGEVVRYDVLRDGTLLAEGGEGTTISWPALGAEEGDPALVEALRASDDEVVRAAVAAYDAYLAEASEGTLPVGSDGSPK